ncbi:hypothetical protein EPUS_05199 [Endocarpon pusillum Z07020]|uniref:Protein kinase domain-containing protein n=1 Tax=Endocarpon pusillum (strain Z07020 / HMAS-L-300199) TaxID=1263415 RepID=U1HJH2_ENDPU|nr:uncharacterized protein EPUS_05199 [Endocarpon pusillum Z07020]ERF70380.1 hypothetical protein EPUS_05199 [Endocarpon pusillum Z07020]
MLPSPSLAAANSNDGRVQATTNAPKHILPVETLPEHDPGHFDFDQNILLSPPPSTVTTDHFHDETNISPTEEPLELDSISHRNIAAYNLNNQWAAQQSQEGLTPPASEPIATGLQIKTDITTTVPSLFSASLDSDSYLRQSISTSSIPRRTPSIRAALHTSAGSLSPGSALSSPQLAAMLNITPLPSPIEISKDPWRLNIRTRSRGSSLANIEAPSERRPSNLSPPSSPPKRKAYNGLHASAGTLPAHRSGADSGSDASDQTQNRSISDYVPDTMISAKPRNVAVSGNLLNQEIVRVQSPMHRERYLAVQRGFSIPSPPLKTPNPSISNLGSFAGQGASGEPQTKKAKTQIYTAKNVANGHARRYKVIRLLGQGTFSKVFLAVRQVEDEDSNIDYTRDSTNLDGVRIRSRRLVAIKVVERGPAGGADAERVEISLRRELEVLKAINHPSLVHLKAFGTDNDRSLLVLNYCPGGDLFEVASSQLEVLVPSLVRRIFAELVSAVRYLHQKYIVHRDIKLENVLLNIPIQVHPDVEDWQTLDRAVITLTDLGLSRRIPEPPESPLLTTRCGSEDYAAPELLMGQPYDGRQTDAWALGVMLYALMEGRLPFDPLPGARGDPAKLKARTPHRIARCEWAWYKYGDEDGEWDSEKGKDYEGARPIIEGLLTRNTRRKTLDEIREMPWVEKGIVIDGGLRRVEEEAL